MKHRNERRCGLTCMPSGVFCLKVQYFEIYPLKLDGWTVIYVTENNIFVTANWIVSNSADEETTSSKPFRFIRAFSDSIWSSTMISMGIVSGVFERTSNYHSRTGTITYKKYCSKLVSCC
jgi:hypothetical protein